MIPTEKELRQLDFDCITAERDARGKLCEELSAKVDNLTEENARLREALERIAGFKNWIELLNRYEETMAAKIAREALGGKGWVIHKEK